MARARKRPPQGQLVQNPDRREVCELMARIWSPPGWEYTQGLLSAYLDRPTGDTSLTVGLHYEDELVGYEVLIPYTLVHEGVERRVVYATFWTSDPDSPVKSVALKVHKELLRLAREKGHSAFLSVTHADSHADKAHQVSLRWLQEEFSILRRFRQLMCRPSRIQKKAGEGLAQGSVVDYSGDLRAGCFKLVAQMPSRVELARTIPEADLDWILRNRPGTRSWVRREDGEVRGFFNVMVKKLLGEQETVNAYIEHAIFGEMSQQEQKAFMATIFADPFWEGINGVYMPDIGYCDPETFKGLGFMKAPAEFNLYFIPLDGSFSVATASGIYFDVF